MAVQIQETRPVSAAQWAQALERALQDGLDVLIEPISGEAFVESATSPGTLYAVTAHTCTCPAGARGLICKHRACLLAQLGELPLPNRVPISTCLRCNGCGRIPNDYRERYDTCPACDGTGVVPVATRPYGLPSVEIVAAAA